jgi:hypothetical protein
MLTDSNRGLERKCGRPTGRGISDRVIRKFARLSILSPLCLFQLGQCFQQDRIVSALADSIALTIAGVAQSTLADAISTISF